MKNNIIIKTDLSDPAKGTVVIHDPRIDPDFVAPTNTYEEGDLRALDINTIATAIITLIRDSGEKGFNKYALMEQAKLALIQYYSGAGGGIDLTESMNLKVV